ncbi:MAG: hypothetical protein ACD_50C00117G0003 [uncultured bacterium]|nr:MAG: hypothetical protein ACD_50C00117G0003 [uncultured bacterium]OGH14773.1 MAG: hypothetical protein A2687_02885 [Candidatus Levybacteria bacterium RIFCSPHIGHO2_01_FULL_38_26]
MDPTPESKPENIKQQEILMPRETARALGAGLRKLMGGQLEQIKPYVNNLKNNPQVKDDDVNAMEESITRVLDLISNLRYSEEVKIIPRIGGSDFVFSEERQEEEEIPQSEIIINDSTTPTLNELNNALQHNFNNALGPLRGHSEMISLGAQDENTRESANQILSRFQAAYNELRPIQTADYQLKISKDVSGDTTITPITRPNTQ